LFLVFVGVGVGVGEGEGEGEGTFPATFWSFAAFFVVSWCFAAFFGGAGILDFESFSRLFALIYV
jgi:hypothetical protein